MSHNQEARAAGTGLRGRFAEVEAAERDVVAGRGEVLADERVDHHRAALHVLQDRLVAQKRLLDGLVPCVSVRMHAPE